MMAEGVPFGHSHNRVSAPDLTVTCAVLGSALTTW